MKMDEVIEPQEEYEKKMLRKEHQLRDEESANWERSPFEEEKYLLMPYFAEIDNVPEHLRRTFFSPINKVHGLGNNTPAEIQSMEADNEVILTLARMTIPEQEYTPEMQLQERQIRQLATSNFRRSKNGFLFKGLVSTHRSFEHRYEEPEYIRNKPSGIRGWFGRIFGVGRKRR